MINKTKEEKSKKKRRDLQKNHPKVQELQRNH